MSAPAPIECPVSKWYFVRLLKLSAMFLLFAGWFYKDGAWTWPKENRIAAERERYEREVQSTFDQAKSKGSLEAWQRQAKDKGWTLSASGEPLNWAAHAARLGWPEKPKKRPQMEIDQQFYWSGAMLAGLLVVAGVALYHRGRKLLGFDDHFQLPNGTRVAHAAAFRIDKRPWAIKGLAYVFYREGGEGRARRAVIDDLKYQGAEKVLDRLLANFHGELIEKQEEGKAPATPKNEAS